MIIIARPQQVLDQKDKSGLTPVFYAIDRGKLDALKKIIEASEGALEQKNQQGENPILYSLNTYSNNPSDSNKKILKLIFQKQISPCKQIKHSLKVYGLMIDYVQ